MNTSVMTTPRDENPNDVLYDAMKYKIAWLSVHEQAKYADPICMAAAHNREFSKEQLIPILEERVDYSRWNSTSMANSAYMALHSHKDYRDTYRMLHEIFTFHAQKSQSVSSQKSCCII